MHSYYNAERVLVDDEPTKLGTFSVNLGSASGFA